jgi:hypothetical protein
MENTTDEEVIRRYLLGEVTPKERRRIQDRLFQDSVFFNELLIIENELTDAYLFGRLNPQQRVQFEQHFLSTPERRRKLTIAQELKDYVRCQSVEEGHAAGWLRRSLSLVWNYLTLHAAVIALAVLLLGTSLSLFGDRQSLKHQLDELHASQDLREQQESLSEMRRQLAEERSQNDALRKLLEEKQKKADEIETQLAQLRRREQDQAVIQRSKNQAAGRNRLIARAEPAVLWPNQRSAQAGANEVRVPQGAKTAPVQINLDEASYPSYKVEVRDENNQPRWSAQGIKSQRTKGGKALIVNIPAHVLTTGNFIIVVQGARMGGFARVDSYQFKVVMR